MKKRGQFTFYRSYYEALMEVSEVEWGGYLMAVVAYGLDGTEPVGLSPVQRAMFRLTRPTLDAGRKMAAGGAKGKPGKRSGKGMAKETEKEKEGEKEGETEKETEKEIEDECLYMDSEFQKFWEEYPLKIGKDKAWDAWLSAKPDAQTVMDRLGLWKRSRQWLQEEGRFVPRAAKWLEERHFDQIPDCGVPKGASGALGQAEIEAIEQMMGGHWDDV